MADEPSDSRGEARQSFFAKQQLIDSARTAFQFLSAILKNATIYPEAHPFLLTSADKLIAKVEELLVGRKEVAFYLVGGELFFETLSVPIDQSLSLIMEQFTSRGIGGIIVKPGVTQTELTHFASLMMNKETAFFISPGNINEVMAHEGISHIEFHRVLLVDKKAGGVIKEGKKKAAEIFMDAIDTVKEIVHAAHLDKTINMRKMNTTVQTLVDNILEDRDAFMGLTSIKMYDEYTFAHSVNTSILAVSLGTFLSFEKPQVAALGVAGLLHDIGKVSLPLEIINKPGKLSEEEWEVIKRHPIEGALILSDVPGVTKLAMVAAFEHHQHGDVRGYPRIDETLKQHPFSQIVSMADAYDAITAARVYYSVRTPPDQAIRILLRQRGIDFHPVLVKTFVKMIGIFPIGTVLKLDTEEIGLVLHQTQDLFRPRVLLLRTFDGTEIEEVSLLEMERGKYKRSPVAAVDANSLKINVNQYLAQE